MYVVGMGCSAPLVSLEMPACGWGPWAWYQPRRKSCEQHSALGGVPALLRGEGVGGGRSVPPCPKEFYKDTDCSLVFDNPILHIPAGLWPSCAPLLRSQPALAFVSYFLYCESCRIPPRKLSPEHPGIHTPSHPSPPLSSISIWGWSLLLLGEGGGGREMKFSYFVVGFHLILSGVGGAEC